VVLLLPVVAETKTNCYFYPILCQQRNTCSGLLALPFFQTNCLTLQVAQRFFLSAICYSTERKSSKRCRFSVSRLFLSELDPLSLLKFLKPFLLYLLAAQSFLVFSSVEKHFSLSFRKQSYSAVLGVRKPHCLWFTRTFNCSYKAG